MDGLLECGLVEEAQARIEAGCPERFDGMILSIAVKKLRAQLAASERRNDELVSRGRQLVAANRPAPVEAKVSRLSDRRRARRAG